jgi:hypothetical protein
MAMLDHSLSEAGINKSVTSEKPLDEEIVVYKSIQRSSPKRSTLLNMLQEVPKPPENDDEDDGEIFEELARRRIQAAKAAAPVLDVAKTLLENLRNSGDQNVQKKETTTRPAWKDHRDLVNF